MLGGLLALAAAAAFALNNVSVRRGVITGSVLQAMVVTVPIGVPFFLVAAVATGALGTLASFSPLALLWLALGGFAHFVWGRYCNYRAIEALGSNLAGPMQQTSLLISLACAVWLLGEDLTVLRVLGIALVVLGPAIVVRRRAARPASIGRAAFRPRYGEGYLFGAISILGYGISPVLVRAALEGASPGAALAGGLVSYIAATIAVLPVLLLRRQRNAVLALDRDAALWFGIGGVSVSVSQMLRYLALALAPVSVVAPIMRISIVFRVIMGWFVNRQHEDFSARAIVGVVVSLVGAVALTVDSDFLLAHAALPDGIAALVRWRWPG